MDPRVSRAVWSLERDVGVASKRGIYSGGALNVDGRGKVKVSGVTHRQGSGAVVDF